MEPFESGILKRDRLLGSLPQHAFVDTGRNGRFTIHQSPSGALLAIADNNTGTIRIWTTATMEQTNPPVSTGNDAAGGLFQRLAFSPKERFLAIGSRSETAQVVDLFSGKVQTIPHGDWARMLSFSNDGRLLATAGSSQPRRAPTRQGVGARLRPADWRDGGAPGPGPRGLLSRLLTIGGGSLR